MSEASKRGDHPTLTDAPELAGGEQEHPVGDAREPRPRWRPVPGPGRRTRCWPGRSRAGDPRCSTGAKGDPVATIARPSVHARTSAGSASETEVGLESGSTMGRSPAASPSTIARTTASLNVPATPVAPTSTVGRRRATDPCPGRPARPCRPRPHRELALGRVQVVPPVVDQPVGVHERDALADLRRRSAHRRASRTAAGGRCRCPPHPRRR